MPRYTLVHSPHLDRRAVARLPPKLMKFIAKLLGYTIVDQWIIESREPGDYLWFTVLILDTETVAIITLKRLTEECIKARYFRIRRHLSLEKSYQAIVT